MLQYERFDVEGMDVNKTSLSEECMLCYHWHFKVFGYKFEEHTFNRSHDLLTMAYGLKNIAILSTKGATFRLDNSRNKGLRRLNNSVLENKGVL